MRYLIPLLALIFILTSCEQDPEIIGFDQGKPKEKEIEICHYNLKKQIVETISIKESEWEEHRLHGDYMFPCDINVPDDQKTYIPDDVFEKYLICRGLDDELDDYVLTKNIINSTSIILDETWDTKWYKDNVKKGVEINPNYSIKDKCWPKNEGGFPYLSINEDNLVKELTGIEDFKYLRVLSLSYHRELTVPNFDSNQYLELVVLFNVRFENKDYYQGEYYTLDFSNHPYLREFTYQGREVKYGGQEYYPTIESIDLSGCDKLYYAGIGTLAEPEYEPLKRINLSNPQDLLLNIDYRHKLPDMECIQVDGTVDFVYGAPLEEYSHILYEDCYY